MEAQAQTVSETNPATIRKGQHRLTGPGPGRPKGSQNSVTRTIKDAIEYACRPGACHPKGLAGWLIDRANGGVADRQIFAGMVAKVLPAQIAAQGAGTVVVNLGWLQGRDLGASVTLTAQGERKPLILEGDKRITDQPDGGEGVGEGATDDTPTPHESAGGGAE